MTLSIKRTSKVSRIPVKRNGKYARTPDGYAIYNAQDFQPLSPQAETPEQDRRILRRYVEFINGR